MSLGRGEVSAAIDALGRSEVAETQFSGVWWIVHKNTAGEVVGELLEIALISTFSARAVTKSTRRQNHCRQYWRNWRSIARLHDGGALERCR